MLTVGRGVWKVACLSLVFVLVLEVLVVYSVAPVKGLSMDCVFGEGNCDVEGAEMEDRVLPNCVEGTEGYVPEGCGWWPWLTCPQRCARDKLRCIQTVQTTFCQGASSGTLGCYNDHISEATSECGCSALGNIPTPIDGNPNTDSWSWWRSCDQGTSGYGYKVDALMAMCGFDDTNAPPAACESALRDLAAYSCDRGVCETEYEDCLADC